MTLKAFSTCDLCDAHELDTSGDFNVLPDVFTSYGGHAAFSGQAVTLRCPEDNSRVREAVQEPGLGRVLVVDGLGSVRRALLGGNLAVMAAKNGWAGVIVYGAVRDVAELQAASIGIKALALCPMRTDKQGVGTRDIPVQIAGMWIRPGDWVYSDADGLVVGGSRLL
jgi:regulator of ribonuclease activity A